MTDFPKHLTLLIEHNPHKNYYQTSKEWFYDYHCCEQADKDEFSEIDDFWKMQWYPNTPIGFHVVFGRTLEECLEKARKLND